MILAIRALVKDFDWLDDAQAEIAALKGNWPKWSTGEVFSPSVLFSSFKIKNYAAIIFKSDRI